MAADQSRAAGSDAASGLAGAGCAIFPLARWLVRQRTGHEPMKNEQLHLLHS